MIVMSFGGVGKLKGKKLSTMDELIGEEGKAGKA
jgi:hypothetical protein